MNSGIREHSILNSFRHCLGRDFYVWSFCLMVLIPCFNYFINDIIQLYMGGSSVSQYFYALISFFSLLTYAKLVSGNRKYRLIVLWVIVFVGVLFSYFNYPNIHEFLLAPNMDPLGSWFIYAPLFLIPISIVTSRCVNWRLILKVLYPVAFITIITGLLSYYLVVFSAGRFFDVNYMSYSYNMLLPFCCTLTYAFVYNCKMGYAVSALAFFAIILAGSRAAAAWAVIYIFMMIYEKFKAKRHLMIGLFISIGIIFVAVSQFTFFSKRALSFMNEHDANSRVLTTISEGDFMNSESRDNINAIITNAIWDNPLLGSGLFADRYYLKQNGLTGYAHNIFREIWCDFGIIFGTIILVLLFVNIYRLYKINNTDFHWVFLLLLPNGVFMLVISGSFLTCLEFWGIVGLMFNPYVKYKFNNYERKQGQVV